MLPDRVSNPGPLTYESGALPIVPGRPTSLENSRAKAYCACSWCGQGWSGYFFSHLSFLLFLPLFGRRPDID